MCTWLILHLKADSWVKKYKISVQVSEMFPPPLVFPVTEFGDTLCEENIEEKLWP